MSDVPPQHRRSRFAWPTTTEPATTSAGTHDHRLRNTPIGMAFVGLILLFLVNAGLIAYILVLKDARDVQQERTQELIRDSWCQALDAFPQGYPTLDSLRERFNCGPGRPVEEFPPDVQQQFRGRAHVTAPETPPGVDVAPEGGFDLPGGASADGGPGEPYYPTPGEPEPEPTVPIPDGFPPPDPVQPTAQAQPGPLDPVTETACDALGVCP